MERGQAPWLESLDLGDGPEGQTVKWYPDSWAELANGHPEVSQAAYFLVVAGQEHQKGGILRRDVRDCFEQLGPERGFVAAMVWGFGPTAYGPHRLGEMLAPPSPSGRGGAMCRMAGWSRMHDTAGP